MSNIHVPIDVSTDAVVEEQLNLRNDVTNQQKACLDMKNAMSMLLSKAIAKAKKGNIGSESSTCSSTSTIKTIKSVESIHVIADDSDDEETNKVDIPHLDEFLSMVDEGQIDISDELMKEMFNVNTRVDALNEVSSDLQKRWCELDTSVKEITTTINNINQYFKIDNLLLHKFPIPPKRMSSLQFSQYVADYLNYILPYLPVPVSWQHISTAHYLPTKAKKSNVVVVRFCNRNIKDMIFNSKQYVRANIAITEHLTEFNLIVLKKARELFGFKNARTEDCKIFIDLEDKSVRVKNVEEVQKTFATYCEFIGSVEHSPREMKSVNVAPRQSFHSRRFFRSHNYASAVNHRPSPQTNYSNTNYSNHSNFNYQSGKSHHSNSRGYRGKRSTGYSVYNRQPSNY